MENKYEKTVASNKWKYMVHLLKNDSWSLNFDEKIPTIRPHLYIIWNVHCFQKEIRSFSNLVIVLKSAFSVFLMDL